MLRIIVTFEIKVKCALIKLLNGHVPFHACPSNLKQKDIINDVIA